MKHKKRLIALFTLFVHNELLADQISLPNTFTAGTKAVAEEVNENFSALASESNSQDLRIVTAEDAMVNVVNESNSQDLRIGALESAATITDQLLCTTLNEGWVQVDATLYCVQRTDPDTLRSLNIAQVLNEGWIAISVGARSVLFNK